MKKILFLLLLISGMAYGQGTYIKNVKPVYRLAFVDGKLVTLKVTIPGYTKINARYEFLAYAVDSGLHIPQYNGTPSGVRVGVWTADGAIGMDTLNHRLYIYSGGAWVRIANFSEIGSAGWALVGNAGTVAGTNFLGTTDGVDLVFKRNNIISGRMSVDNISFGDSALANVAPSGFFGVWNVGIGYKALKKITSRYDNTAIGYTVLESMVTGDNNVAIGAKAMALSTTASKNIAIGFEAMQSVKSNNNIGIGYNALKKDTSTTGGNTAIGSNALTNNLTGYYNTAVGADALPSNTTGYSNTAIGKNALYLSTTGFQNASFGAGGMENNTTGTGNTGNGYDNGLNNTTGNYNTWSGWNSKSGSNGLGNSMYGYRSGFFLAAGNQYNIGIGYGTMDNASQKVDAINSIAIGQGVFTEADNQIRIGNSSHTQTWLRGLLYFDGATGTGLQSIRVNAGATGMEYYTPSTVATAVPISGLTAATAGNGIDNGNFGQGWSWSTLNASNGLQLTSTSTAETAISSLLYVTLSGVHSASDATTYAGSFINTKSGTNSINYGVRGNAANATTNYGGYFSASAGTTNIAVNIAAGSLALNGSAGTTGQVLTSAGANTLPTWETPAAGGGTPAGNFGNLQIGRNGAFATPGSDSLDFESATGLQVKGNIGSTGTITSSGGNISSTTGFVGGTSIQVDGSEVFNTSGLVLQIGLGGFTSTTLGSGASYILQFAGTTSSFPALQRSGADLMVVDASGGAASRLGIGIAPTSSLHTSSFATAYTAQTATYPITATDYTIECTANTFTTTLPTAVGCTGRMYFITNSGAGTITLATTSSQVFVNVVATPTTLAIATLTGIVVQSNGTGWLKVSSF